MWQAAAAAERAATVGGLEAHLAEALAEQASRRAAHAAWLMAVLAGCVVCMV